MIRALEETRLPVTSVDAPSSWNIESGPPETGVGSSFNPAVLVSLTAPKPLVQFFKGRHFVGGRSGAHIASYHGDVLSSRTLNLATDIPCRFVSPAIAKKYNLDLPPYEGIDQIVEVDSNGQKL